MNKSNVSKSIKVHTILMQNGIQRAAKDIIEKQFTLFIPSALRTASQSDTPFLTSYIIVGTPLGYMGVMAFTNHAIPHEQAIINLMIVNEQGKAICNNKALVGSTNVDAIFSGSCIVIVANHTEASETTWLFSLREIRFI